MRRRVDGNAVDTPQPAYRLVGAQQRGDFDAVAAAAARAQRVVERLADFGKKLGGVGYEVGVGVGERVDEIFGAR